MDLIALGASKGESIYLLSGVGTIAFGTAFVIYLRRLKEKLRRTILRSLSKWN